MGMSRAKQCAISTCCKRRGTHKGESDLYGLLAVADVPEKMFN